jgi:hypothetical protein
MRFFGVHPRQSRQDQLAIGESVIKREIVRLPADAVERVASDWPRRRAQAGWWDHRRGERLAAWGARLAISERMRALAPDTYVYFDSSMDVPSQEDYDQRWEAVACALEDVVYAELTKEQASLEAYRRLRAHWDLLCAP